MNRLLEQAKDKKFYLIITLIFFMFIIFMNSPFSEEKNMYISKNAESLTQQTDFLLKDTTVSQEFTAVRDGLETVGFKTVTQDRIISSNINVEIIEVESGKTIYKQDTSLSEAKNDLYFEIKFDRQKDSKNKKYEIIFTSLDAEKETATMFGLAPRDENSDEVYKYNGEEVKDLKVMLITEYYSLATIVLNIFLWLLIYMLSNVFILYGLDGADENTFLKLATIIAVLYIFFNPFPHYLDEGAHFFRAVLISQGDIYDEVNEDGEIGGYVSKNFLDYAINGITLKKISNNTAPTGDLFGGEKIFNPFKYFSSTVPTGHAIPAIALLFGNIINLNSSLTIYLSRLLPYVFYVACSYYAIKNLKHYKSLMFVVSTLPIAFYLAGSVSIDPIINGSAFLFISICLKYYFEDDENTYISKLDIALIIVSAIFIVTNKYFSYTPILLLFFLIPKKKFKTTKAYVIMIVVSIIIGLLCVIWQFYMLNMFPYIEDRNENVDQVQQIKFILGHPIFVARTIITHCLGFSKAHVLMFTADPIGCFPDLTGIALVLGAVLEKSKFEDEKKSKKFSIIVLTIFILSLLLATVALYLSYTPVGNNKVSGYQIRYNVPIMILLLIPIANLCHIENKTKNYERRLAFLMFFLNLDSLLALLIETFTRI